MNPNHNWQPLRRAPTCTANSMSSRQWYTLYKPHIVALCCKLVGLFAIRRAFTVNICITRFRSDSGKHLRPLRIVNYDPLKVDEFCFELFQIESQINNANLTLHRFLAENYNLTISTNIVNIRPNKVAYNYLFENSPCAQRAFSSPNIAPNVD